MTEDIYKLVLLGGLVILATVLGVLALYAHTIMPGLRSTDNTTFVRAFQAIDGRIVNPIFMAQFFLPLFLLGAAGWYAHKHQLVETKYIAAAFVCYLLALAITMAVNVPLNDGIKKVTDTTSAESVASAREQFNESKWVLWNHVRTGLSLVASGCTAAAVWVSKLI